MIAAKEAEELERQIAKESEHEQILNIQREYYSIVDDAITNLKKKLKNPSTLNLLEIIVVHYYTKELAEVNIAIHYTAQNNLGADLDSYFHYTPSKKQG